MKNLLKNSYWFFLLISVFFVFKNLFVGNLYYGGDAPYFYTDALARLFSDPSVWTERGCSFGGINLTLWLSPVMIIYGALGKFLSLNNDAIVRILFIIPSISLSFVGPYLLTKYLKLSKTVQFFSVLVYVFNTYFLLLLDGGQVGVALAYGIFPITLLFLKKFVDIKSKNNFLTALIFLTLLSVIDPRIMIVCFLTVLIWSLLEKKFSYWFIPIGILLILINFYWIYPFLKLGSGDISSSVSGLEILSLINPLTLFSPHWPANIFGKISYPQFYFVAIPILTFGSFLIKKNKQNLTFAFLLLFFAFLTKGETSPLGINLSYVFRDSSKFFIPVILFTGILIGNTIDILNKNFYKVVVFLYILFLISPAFLGKMNFLMSTNTSDTNFLKIADEISSQKQQFRTLWFTNKNPLSYESVDNPAIDATSLANFRPFAEMNNSEDVFNFLNNKNYIDWLRVLGIRYVYLIGDYRNIYPTETDIKNWNVIKELVNDSFDNNKYEITNPYPKFYAVDKLIAVVGSWGLPENAKFTPAIYFEDGKWDPSTLYDNKPDSIDVFFNNGTKFDLTMSFLQKYFVSPLDNKNSEWSVFSTAEYLKYKYQLLIRDFIFNDFDYGKGIAFSTKTGESISFKLDVPKTGEYVVAKRISSIDKQKFEWVIEEKYLEKGKFEFVVTNDNEFMVLNVVATIPKGDYEKALILTDQTIDKFGVVTKINNTEDIKKIDVTNLGTSKYLIDSKNIGYWIILSENYNPWWKLKRGLNYAESYPVYSMLNAFYVDPLWNNLNIEFTGQTIFRWGIWGSVLTTLVLAIYFLCQKENH